MKENSKKVFGFLISISMSLILLTGISLMAFASVVNNGVVIYVSKAGNDVNDGLTPETSKASIQAAINAAQDGDTIELSEGIYAENLTITKNLTLTGPVSVSGAEPLAIIQPAVPSDTGAIIEVGDSTNASLSTPNVSINYIKIDGSIVSQNAPNYFRGVYFRPGSSGNLKNSLIISIKPRAVGIQNGYGIVANDSNVDIENNTIKDFGKVAISLSGRGIANVRNNRLEGTNPVESGSQLSQNGVFYRENRTGEVVGNTFVNFGPSGASNANYGGAMVASDGTTGYAIGFMTSLSASSNIAVTGNIFINVQGIFFDGRLLEPTKKASAIKANVFLQNNTIQGNKYFVYGPISEGAFINGQREDDPNHLNYILKDIDTSIYSSPTITLGAGIYNLINSMENPSSQIQLASYGGSVEVDIPQDKPENVTSQGEVIIKSPNYADILNIKAAITWDIIKGQNNSLDNIISKLVLPLDDTQLGNLGVLVSWKSSNPAFISDSGSVTRPAYEGGDAAVKLIVTLVKGTEKDTKEFNVVVKQFETAFTTNTVYRVGNTYNAIVLATNQMLDATTTVKNNQANAQNVLLIVALYDQNGSMANVSYLSKNVYQGITETLHAGFKLPVVIDGYVVKAFVWDGTDLISSPMTPLSNVSRMP